MWDHPHAYGDKPLAFDAAQCIGGSSPRVWGQVKSLTLPLMLLRIIPTRMGTRSEKHFLTPKATDHPHAYGDKRVNSFITEYNQRIIPTRMGTRTHCIIKMLSKRDHPHAYGDKDVCE